MKHVRKRIWIDPFQTGLLIRITVNLIIYQIIAWAFFIFCEQIHDALATIGADGPFVTNSLVRTLVVLLILVPPLAWDAMRFSHRLVGPLYRFRKTMQAIAAGEPVTLVQLRQGDLLLDFKDDFNLMLETLEQKGLIIVNEKASPNAANAETTAVVV